jgi:hypothetical protein
MRLEGLGQLKAPITSSETVPQPVTLLRQLKFWTQEQLRDWPLQLPFPAYAVVIQRRFQCLDYTADGRMIDER